jgi:hypothetical protein
MRGLMRTPILMSICAVALTWQVVAAAAQSPAPPASGVTTGAIPPGGAAAPVRGTKAVAERPARVFVLASFDPQCQPVQPAQISLDRPPVKGTVTFREGQTTTVQYSLSGKCIGTKLPGTGIYYTAAKGQTGTDSFTISARLPTGELATRTFTVEIADE